VAQDPRLGEDPYGGLMDGTPTTEDARTEDEKVATYIRENFGVEVPGGEPAAPDDDDVNVDAYLRHHFGR
jgi:hypothetical protein